MEKKSKSQKKREMLALQELGEQLVNLSAERIRKIEMPEELREAVLFGRTLKKNEARRRHMQYIGVLMRDADPEPIRQAIEETTRSRNLDVRTFQQVEQWRDDLVSGKNETLEHILARFPDSDHPLLHQLVLDARREREVGTPAGSSRALFRYLMELARGEQV